MPNFGLSTLPSRLPSDHQRVNISTGITGTAQTIRKMKSLVTHGKRDFRIRKLAIKLVKNCPHKDYSCFAQACYDYCTTQIRYVFDPNGVELLESPWKIVEAGGADCDSIVILLASLLESVGLACEFVTIKADTNRPNEFSHVYLECKIPKQGWVALDATMPENGFGWKPAPTFPRKRWAASKDGAEIHDGDKMAGLGADIPHLENTPGLVVGSEWNFRMESAIVTEDPAAMELAPMSDAEPPPFQREEEFLDRAQLDQVFSGNSNVAIEVVEPFYKKPAFLIGAALLGLLWLKK